MEEESIEEDSHVEESIVENDDEVSQEELQEYMNDLSEKEGEEEEEDEEEEEEEEEEEDEEGDEGEEGEEGVKERRSEGKEKEALGGDNPDVDDERVQGGVNEHVTERGSKAKQKKYVLFSSLTHL